MQVHHNYSIDISARGETFKVDIKDPNFDKPLSELNKDYSKQQTGILIFKVK